MLESLPPAPAREMGKSLQGVTSPGYRERGWMVAGGGGMGRGPLQAYEPPILVTTLSPGPSTALGT